MRLSEINNFIRAYVKDNAIIIKGESGIGHYECHGHTGYQSSDFFELHSCPDFNIAISLDDMALPTADDAHEISEFILDEIDCPSVDVTCDNDATLTIDIHATVRFKDDQAMLTFSFF